mgnify:CR=1 FL=1
MKIKKTCTIKLINGESKTITINEVKIPSSEEIMSNTYEMPIWYNGVIPAIFVNNKDQDAEWGIEATYGGNPYDTGCVVDIVPIVKTNEPLEKGKFYLLETWNGDIPFQAQSEDTLVCCTRTGLIVEFEGFESVSQYKELQKTCLKDFVESL